MSTKLSSGRRLLILCLVTIVALTAFVFIKNWKEKEAAPNDDDAVAVLSQQMDNISRRIDFVQRQVNIGSLLSPNHNGSDAEDNKEEVDNQVDVANENSKQQQNKLSDEQRVEKITDQLEHFHAYEAVDRSWAIEKEQNIEDFISTLSSIDPEKYEDPNYVDDVLSKIKLVSTECRSTICRTEVEHTQDRKVREAFLRFLGAEPFDGATFFRSTDEGTRTIAYTARNGHDLPQINLNI